MGYSIVPLQSVQGDPASPIPVSSFRFQLGHIPFYMYIHGSALCLEYGMSWVRVLPEAAHFF